MGRTNEEQIAERAEGWTEEDLEGEREKTRSYSKHKPVSVKRLVHLSIS